MTPTFKIGDSVSLKSRGPIMTILALTEDPLEGPQAECCWFDTDRRMMKHTFPLAALKLSEGS